jgi:hypothetical protein
MSNVNVDLLAKPLPKVSYFDKRRGLVVNSLERCGHFYQDSLKPKRFKRYQFNFFRTKQTADKMLNFTTYENNVTC